MRREAKHAAAWVLLRSGTLAVHRRVRERGRAAVLMYHRVNDERDPFYPALPSGTFRRQIEYLAGRYRIEPLENVAEWLSEGAPGPARVAITIDDGYPDTHDVVLPILQELGAPATVFLATRPPETGTPLWLDRVRHLFKHTRRSAIALPALATKSIALGDAGERVKVMRRLARRLKHLPARALDGALRELEDQLAVREPWGSPLTWDQVRAMDRGPIDIGAHTHTHYLLSTLEDRELSDEIERSIQLIEHRVGRRPTTFAYPNGEPADFDERAKKQLRGLGLRCAVTTANGFARPGQDSMAFPRVYTSEQNLPLFAARLAGLGREVA